MANATAAALVFCKNLRRSVRYRFDMDFLM